MILGNSTNELGRYTAVNDPGEIVAKLNTEYYEAIDDLCGKISHNIIQLKEKNAVQTTSIYSNLCFSVVSELRFLTEQRRNKVIPFIQELADKNKHEDDHEHDCASCGGGCKMALANVINEIEDTHTRTRDLLYRVQKVALPLYSEMYFSDLYSKLRHDMTLLTVKTTELFYLEEAALLTGITTPKKKKYAVD